MKPVFRCSELAQILVCPGSKILRAKLAPEDTDSAAALAGKWCHAKGALRLIEEEGAVGPEITLPDFKPSRMHDFIVSYWIDTVRCWVESYMAIEVEQPFEWEFDRFILTGHHDVFAIDAQGTEAVGLDLKSGSEPVEAAEENPQVLGYMVLEALNYESLKKISFALVQPQNDPDSGYERVSHVIVEGRDKLMGFAQYLEREVNWALDNSRLLNSDGWRQCHYCPAALICPAFAADVKAMKLELTEEQIAAIPKEPDIERLWHFVQAGKKFDTPLSQAHAVLKVRVAALGGAVLEDGTRLAVVDRPGFRVITDNAAASQKLNDLPENLWHRCYKFLPTHIEEALAEFAQVPKTSKKGPSGQSLYKERLGDLTEQAAQKVLKVS